MKTSPRLILVFLTLTVLLLSGCGENTQECTLIGCESGIVLSFEDPDGEPIRKFQGEVNADGKVIEVECGTDTDIGGTDYLCRDNELFVRIDPVDALSLNLRAIDNGDLAYIGGVAVDFKPQYPNGEACGAACERAETTVVMEITQAGTN